MATFDYESFMTLQSLELCRYMEPLVADPGTSVPQEALHRMLAELDTYDQYHLVYALELGSKYFPDLFVKAVPRFLAREEGSVRGTVLRILERLSRKHLSDELIGVVRRSIAPGPLHDVAKRVLAQLESRLQTE
jgi:hypothetical protein